MARELRKVGGVKCQPFRNSHVVAIGQCKVSGGAAKMLCDGIRRFECSHGKWKVCCKW